MRAPILLTLALAPLAAAEDGFEIRYVAGTGHPNGGIFCLEAFETTQNLEPDALGGACLVPVTPGVWIVETVDDDTGDVRFAYDLRSDATHRSCADGFTHGPLALDVAEGCDQLTIHPEIGSLAGRILIDPLLPG